MKDVDLSIYVTTYNHEQYIVEALDSILKQETNYVYEVLIGEDVSKDNTRLILQNYEKKYKNKLTIYYRDHNMYNEIPNNGDDLRNRCKGKYVIALEGDDFWIAKDKINKQIEFLDNHPEYIAVSHQCIVVNEKSIPTGEHYPECKQKNYTINHFASGILPGQLATVMYRNINYMEEVDCTILYKGLMPWDRLLYFVLISHGKVYCMQEKMSAYRLIRDKGSSFSANYMYDYSNEIRWNRELLMYAKRIKKNNSIKYAEAIFVNILFSAYRKNYCNFNDLCNEMKNIDHKIRAIYMWIKAKILRYIFRRKVFY